MCVYSSFRNDVPYGIPRGSKATIRVDPYFKKPGRSVKIRVDPYFYGSTRIFEIRVDPYRPVFLRIDPYFWNTGRPVSVLLTLLLHHSSPSGSAVRNHFRTHPAPCVVFVVFCMHMHSFAGLIRRTPPPTSSDTEITDRHSDTTIFQLRAQWVRIFWSIGSEKSFEHVPPVGVEPSTSCVHPIH